MLTVLLVIQIIIALAMVGTILIQRSASDGLSGLSGGSSGNSLLSGRASANLLTRTTAFLALAFMVNSLAMATLTSRSSSVGGASILDNIEHTDSATPPAQEGESTTAPTPSPEEEQEPSVPIAE